MDYLIKLLGDYSIGWAITVIAALVFLGLCYRKVEKYFSDKAIHEKEKNEQFKKVMDQVNMYPTWHQQSLEIQQQFNTSIAELKEGMEKQQEKTITIAPVFYEPGQEPHAGMERNGGRRILVHV